MDLIKKTLIIPLSYILIFSCSDNNHNEEKENKIEENNSDKNTIQAIEEVRKNPYENANIEVKIIDNTKSQNSEPKISGFGYDILVDGTLFIHQPNIPAVPGNNGFKNEADAKKVAELMTYKIKNNIVPPTITIEEMDSLKVLNK